MPKVMLIYVNWCRSKTCSALSKVNPFIPTGAFNICCPRDCVSRHNGGTSGAPLKPLRDDSALRVRECKSLPLRSGHIYLEDAPSAESNEKSYFFILFLQFWLILFKIYGDTPGVPLTKKKLLKSGKIFMKDVH